jgi:hypothetical protein
MECGILYRMVAEWIGLCAMLATRRTEGRHQENRDFEQVVGLGNGHSVSTNVEDFIELDEDDDEVVVIIEGDNYDGLGGNDLDGSVLSGGNGNENARCPRASSLAAQPSACGLREGDVARRVAKRFLLEQTIANSVAKKPDGDCWFGKGENPKKARHQDAQERMDNLMKGMVEQGSLMRQAIKDLTSGRAADNPTMTKEKEFGIISNNMKKLLEVKAKLIALNMNTSDVDLLIQKKLPELASH